MNDDRPRGSNELILNPGEYAFLQDNTKGNVQTHVGPLVVTQTGQLRPIRYRTGRFHDCSLQDTAERCVSAKKGEYLVLSNPTIEMQGLKHPTPAGNNTSVPDLRHGEKIVVPGPVEFPLWPQQEAQVVAGHHLRPDQYLLVRVYDEDAAVDNWDEAVASTADDDTTTIVSQTATELGLTLGQLLVIKDVSFYIPPTGIEVVPEDDNFVRDALTLEMSEYAILVDQSGAKRYEKGPQIVYPTATEEFFADSAGNIKFRPIELTSTQGLHIKINCAYTADEWPVVNADGGVVSIGRTFKEGDEIFITGDTHPMYYPCEEHSIVRYGDNLIHYATAVSAGQARYVMDKDTGEIETREGPDMILLNPINEVFVTRVLSDAECQLMYPGNGEALAYNRSKRETRPESDLEMLDHKTTSSQLLAYEGVALRSMKATAAAPALPDQIRRKTTYTKPHSVVLDDKFSGAPNINVWTGYAVLLTRANGDRRMVVGPKIVSLEFDETMAPLHLSTGKPKTTDRLLTTGYLEVANNKVGDIISVTTGDGIDVQLKVSYRVSFNGDHSGWFNIDNYVKFLCDHARSLLKGKARKSMVREFCLDTVDIVRDTLLGEKTEGQPRTGLEFPENGMVVTDVELLDVQIVNSEIAELLERQQQEVITNQIATDRSQQQFEVETARQKVALKTLGLQEELRTATVGCKEAELTDAKNLDAIRAQLELLKAQQATELAEEMQAANAASHAQSMQQRTEVAQLAKEVAQSETENVIAKFKAAEGDLALALQQLGDKEVMTKVAEAMGPMGLIGDVDLATIIGGVLGNGSQRSGLFNRLTSLATGSE